MINCHVTVDVSNHNINPDITNCHVTFLDYSWHHFFTGDEKGDQKSIAKMSNIAQQRIQREFREVVKSEEVAKSGVQLTLVNDDLTELKGTIAGPPDTPYEGGTYILEIKIPDTYPFNPPKVRFVTKIWHPNISSVTGAICLDILKDQWAAAMTLRTVLLSLQVSLNTHCSFIKNVFL